ARRRSRLIVRRCWPTCRRHLSARADHSAAPLTRSCPPTSMARHSRRPVLPPPSLDSRVRAPILITRPIIFTPTLRRPLIRPLRLSPHQPRRALPPSAPPLARVCRRQVLPPVVTWMVSVTV